MGQKAFFAVRVFDSNADANPEPPKIASHQMNVKKTLNKTQLLEIEYGSFTIQYNTKWNGK